ncbi:MAG: hypothetical protein ACOH16_12650 [Propionibacteriaceae bacterium]
MPSTRIAITGKGPRIGIALAVLVMTVLGVLVDAAVIESVGPGHLPRKGGPADLVLILLAVPITLALHEAIHGLAFLVFGGRPRYRIGLLVGIPSVFVCSEGLVVA